MCKLSVIVPVYNEEKTIGRCLDSLLLQELQDMEILVVNDGSTDESGKVVRAYMEKDPRVRMIEQENRGLGAARNSGIRAAKGNYIGFVDSDDFVDLAMYRVMVDPWKTQMHRWLSARRKMFIWRTGHAISSMKRNFR